MKSPVSKILPALFLLLSSACFLNGQTSFRNTSEQDALPAVFILGEYDVQYEAKMPNYKTLLESCDGNMELAYGKLMGMMQEMEAYAELSDYDLKGITAWMHFFWRKDGTIEHIGFHLKPNSRNVDLDGLKDFLNEFASNYRFPLNAPSQYAHYSSFSFPLNFKKQDRTAKNGN